MQNNLLKISLAFMAFGLFVGCSTINKLVPKEKKPFQERSFDSKLWREGDAQIRGEMSKDLLWKKDEKQNYFLSRKTREQISETLGEPDRKTRGKCCGAGGTYEEEVWLYELETKDDGKTQSQTEHFQIYFTPEGKVDETRIALWNDKNPDFYPRVG